MGLWNAFVDEVAPITGPVYQLFIFFMITDPKSTVQGVRPQMAVAASVAAAECVLRLTGQRPCPVLRPVPGRPDGEPDRDHPLSKKRPAGAADLRGRG